MEIKVESSIGEFCITQEDGRILYNLIKKNIDKYGKVTINFSNVMCIHVFMRESIGTLFKHMSIEEFNKTVTIKGLDKDNESLFRDVIQTYSEVYSESIGT